MIVLDLLSWISALRFPLLFAILMLLIGFWAPRSPLLHGIFDVPPRRIWWVVISGLASTASIVVSGWVIVMGAPERLETPGWIVQKQTPVLAQALIAALLIAPSLYQVWRASAASLLSKAAQFGLSILAVGFTGIALNRLLDRIPGLTDWFAGIFQAIGPGYVDKQGHPQMAHVYCACWMILTLAIYFAMGFWRLFALKRAQAFKARIPSLAVFFILISFLVSLFSEVGFILDYWHVPSLATLAGIVAVAALFRSSDHTFEVSAADLAPVPPDRALEASGHKDVIVVAASGGGIHLAGWTAKVLGELSQIPGFTERVRLVSSVSGGSAGSLYWLQSVYEGKVDARKVFDAATRSSLDSVAWGLLYADLLRALIPVVPSHIDRGWALERAWMHGWNFPSKLSDWRDAVLKGKMPAVLFNTTAVETGEIITFPTTDLQERPDKLDVRRTFYEVHPGKDVSPVTAARLSATFPFVTAAARASEGETLHFADGGYFDNFGTASIAQWLRDAVRTEPRTRVERILVVNITGYIPTRTKADEDAAKRTASAPYPFQLYAPVQTMLTVRDTSQRTTRHVELKLLSEAMLNRGVSIERVDFSYPDTNQPLSWHLTNPEIKNLNDAWTEAKDIQENRAAVEQFIAGKKALAAHPY